MFSATPTTYPFYCLAFFVTSRRVHLDLQTLLCLFFSFGFFLLVFYLRLALLLPRPQIKQLGTFILYLTTLPAKIELFGQISFSNLQQKLKDGMTQLRLLDHPFRSGAASTNCRYVSSTRIWDLCIIKVDHIGTFPANHEKWNLLV